MYGPDDAGALPDGSRDALEGAGAGIACANAPGRLYRTTAVFHQLHRSAPGEYQVVARERSSTRSQPGAPI
jgi:hypothetical protein